MSAGEALSGRVAVARAVAIRNEKGLHARAAARFVKAAGRYACEITVTKGGQTVSARSVLGLMMLAAGPGTELVITARGPDAAEAAEVLRRLVEGGFGEG